MLVVTRPMHDAGEVFAAFATRTRDVGQRAALAGGAPARRSTSRAVSPTCQHWRTVRLRTRGSRPR